MRFTGVVFRWFSKETLCSKAMMEPHYRVVGRWVFAAGTICLTTSIFFINVGNTTLYMAVAGIVLILMGALTQPFGEL